MHKTWWKESVIYQIYPRSFMDSNGDGIGDLRGILHRLDYLQSLGIDVVWLGPVYKSPNDDNGYDISDYRDIMDEFGTLADWEALLDGLHQRGIKLVMDLVVNHTSDEHPWFIESRKSKDNPYRDYYIWRPGKDGREPNNWASFFSPSAWEFDPATGEYYLHLFSKKQPDLNWENPAVRGEVFEMMRWWLDKGIDGFRMDVINMISKAPGLPSVPAPGLPSVPAPGLPSVPAPGLPSVPAPGLPDGAAPGGSRYGDGSPYYMNGPRLLEFLGQMKREVLSHYDLLTVGETPGVTPEQALRIVGEDSGALSMLFQFEHMELDADPELGNKRSVRPLSLPEWKKVMTRWQKGLEGGGWNSLYLMNHDQARAVSRFGDDREYRVQSAKLLATFNHLLQGTPYIYQGEEIGMTNVAFESLDDYRDIEGFNIYRELVEEREMSPQAALAILHAKGRDNARTPMQWDDSRNAGFTSGTPWIKVNPNYTEINVQQALADPGSIFYYYQSLIRLRKANPIMVYGTYDLLLPEHAQIYAFTRTLQDERLLIILNWSGETPTFELPGEIRFSGQSLLIANYPVDPQQDLRRLPLRPWEARLHRLEN